MGIIKKFIKGNDDNKEVITAIYIPFKKKTISNGLIRKRLFGIRFFKKYVGPKASEQPVKNSNKKIAFFVGCPDGRSERYSVLDICESLQKKHIDTQKIYPPYEVTDDELSTFSLIVFFRFPVSRRFNGNCIELFYRVTRLGIPCIFSVDDYIFDKSVISHFPNYNEMDQAQITEANDGVAAYINTINFCDSAFVTSNFLKDKIAGLVKESFMFPCLISETQFAVANAVNQKSKEERDRISICYLSGTPSHNKDFAIAEDAILRILKDYPHTQLVLVGPLKLSAKFDKVGDQVVRHELMPYLDLMEFTSKNDINIAPLDSNSIFANAKAPTKIVEASIVKVPTVASAIPSYCECIVNGETGFIAQNEDEWYNALSCLIENKQLRSEIGEKAYKYAYDNYYIGNRIDSIISCYKQVINNKKNEQVEYDELLKKIFTKKESELNPKKLDIAFLIPAPIAGGGGHRNIFRAVTFLKKSGHSVSVYYTDSDLSAYTLKKLCSLWFYDMSGINFIKYEGKLGYHDVAIATYWTTAYEIKKQEDHFKYKFYFTQDFEALFNPMSSNYILAENSYRLGFYHICSGPWMHRCITKKFGVKSDYFQFPVDKDIYNTSVPRLKKNKNIIFFAKPEMHRRCFELGIMALSVFNKLCPDVEIILFGSKNLNKDIVPFPCTIKSLLPTISDLADLYRNADLGLVFSTTNPSLVPYEMMSCGCPVADLNYDDPLAKYGNSVDNVFLLDPIPEIMGRQLSEIFKDSELMRRKANSGKDFVLREFPSEAQMGSKFEQIILENIK